MSRLATLMYNPHNYKNFCNVFEENDDDCSGCPWNPSGFVCVIPIYDRVIVEGVLSNVSTR